MPVISENELKKQIKNKEFAKVYMIYGTEQMYIRQYAQKLTEAVAGKNPSDFSVHRFGGEVDIDSLASAVQSVSFFSEYNCVTVTDMFFDSFDKAELQKLKEVPDIVPDGTVLIFAMPSYIPKKNAAQFTSFVKKLEKTGAVVKFEKPDERTLERYVVKWANENGKFIPQVCVSRLIQRCGTDMNMLKNEVDKISAHARGEEITLEDVDALATVTAEAKVFDLSTALLNGNGDAAYQILELLFNQKEEPASILSVMSMAFVDAYNIRIADESGVQAAVAAEDLKYGKRTFVLNKARRATSRVSTEALKKCLDILIDADVRMKTAAVNYRLLLEQTIAQLLLIIREGKK